MTPNSVTISELLKTQILALTFGLSNGDTVQMLATRCEDLMPAQPLTSHPGPENTDLYVVWSLTHQAWRSFAWHRVLSWRVVPRTWS